MKKSILLSVIILMTSCATSNKATHLGSLHKSDKKHDQLTQVKLTHQPVFLFKTEIQDTVSGRRLYKKLPQDLKPRYDSIMLHTEQYQIELGEEYQVIQQLNRKKNQEMLAFLYKNHPVQMVTSINYILPKNEQGKIDLTKDYFLNTHPEQSENDKLFSGKDTIMLNPEYVLSTNPEYVCMIKAHGKYKVVSLEDKKRKCPKEKDKLSRYNFN